MSRVTLEPMNQAQFVGFMEAVFPSYVAERAAADHVSLEMAEQYARVQLARLLPDGHLTVGHRFLRVLSTDSGQGVGDVWFWIDSENKQAFLYYIAVLPEHRRRGFASAALVAIEEMVRAAGCISLGLNVFSSNHGAIALYRRLGFCTVASYWTKPL
jgi:ribosomal protein S18 acetylase RimI-like enzyme